MLETFKTAIVSKETRRVCLTIILAMVIVLTINGFSYRSVYLNSLPKDVFNIPLSETWLFLFITYGGVISLVSGFVTAISVLHFLSKRFNHEVLRFEIPKTFFRLAGFVVLFSPVITCIDIAGNYRLNDIAFITLVVTLVLYVVLREVSKREL
ncbi:hypothetical protein [Bacillus toyonensis]|uniref:hypothetical protein n=1 Tax=Bacillus toyonensis TaxID=155322 RepID=UPI000BF5A168|nr:hypothetical protein [Bacillus toyonensis]PGF05001.1 hypothetical protein COM61_00770 [Bacillus toyonensis]